MHHLFGKLPFFMILISSVGSQAKAETLDDGIRYFLNKKYSASEQIFRKLLITDQANPVLWFNLANAEYSQGHFLQAVSSYQKVVHLKSGLSPAAHLYSAKAYRQEKKYAEAGAELHQISRSRLSAGLEGAIQNESVTLQDEILDQAMILYRSHQESQAIRLLHSSLKLSADSDSEMMLGMSELRLGHVGEAKISFQKVIASSEDAKLREEAKGFLKQIREETFNRLPYWGLIDFALGPNSNIFAVGDSVGTTGGLMTEAEVELGYRAIQEGDFTGSIRNNILNGETLGQPTLAYFTEILSVPLKYNPPNWLLQVTPQYKYEIFGGTPFLSQPAIELGVQRSFMNIDLGGSYQVLKNFTTNPIYDYMGGNSQVRRVYVGYNQSEYDLQLSYIDSINNIGDFVTPTSTLPLANNSHGIKLSAWKSLAERLSLDSRVGYYAINYKNLALPDKVLRNDTQWDTFLKLSYSLSSTLKIYSSEEFIYNQSNLGPFNTTNKNYNDNIFLIGFSWNIL